MRDLFPTKLPLLLLSLLIACGRAEQHRHLELAARAAATTVGNGPVQYYGGPVIANVQVVVVLYGSSDGYLPELSHAVANAAPPHMGSFYQQVTVSPYFDILSEYSTQPVGGSQTIGHGTYVGAYQIAPAPENNGSTIDSSNVYTELTNQITNGQLPAPTLGTDSFYSNTYYAVFFPPAKVLTYKNGAGSCNADPAIYPDRFCGFHGSFVVNGVMAGYGVHADQSAPACAGCGSGIGTPFDRLTTLASHELVEAVTDLEQDQNTISWGDPNGPNGTINEIGDLCDTEDASEKGSFVGSDGFTYALQNSFSNLAYLDNGGVGCISSRPNLAGFVSQSVPASLQVGAQATATITLRNDGTTPWTAAAGHHLASAVGDVWGVSAVALSSGEQIAPGASKQFQLAIRAPASPGAYSFQWGMALGSGAAFPADTPALTIQAVSPPALQLAPQSLAFGNVSVRSQASSVVQVQNPGGVALAFSATQPASGPFYLSCASPCSCGAGVCSGQVAPNAQLPLTVTFVPPGRGTFTSSIAFSSNASATATPLPVSGAGVQGSLAVSPVVYTFPSVVVPSFTADVSLTLSNTGDGPLTIAGFNSSTHRCSQDGGPVKPIILPQRSAVISVHCQLLVAGPFQDTFLIATSGGSPPRGVVLDARGLPGAMP